MGRGRVALVAGGYTGGHIQCALAIAAALERAGTTCVLGGADGGREVAAAASSGYPIETVWIGPLDRAASARGLARNLKFLVQLAVSRRQARRLSERAVRARGAEPRHPDGDPRGQRAAGAGESPPRPARARGLSWRRRGGELLSEERRHREPGAAGAGRGAAGGGAGAARVE